ncbi:hypothetical protein BGZ61DRAFT_469076, partial [Ilyonectria robusta]|uniref:uncharacterized protein n=1 Tax=Ilyonectria robusta TaxID=1079257 RepID=UPI001E8D8CE2
MHPGAWPGELVGADTALAAPAPSARLTVAPPLLPVSPFRTFSPTLRHPLSDTPSRHPLSDIPFRSAIPNPLAACVLLANPPKVTTSPPP